jgi:predicted metal-dependent phosphoesterase TrpH
LVITRRGAARSACEFGPFCAIPSGKILEQATAVLKVEFHTHSDDDPFDEIPYSTNELIDRAAALGYDALAVTLHDRQLDIRPFAAYAAERGVTLIPGIERTIEGKHVLLLNFQRGAEAVSSFADLARLKAEEPGLVIAPHPFFPSPTCLRGRMDRHVELFDAVEYNAMFTRALNFNRAAERWARAHGRPMVGNGDVHRLNQLGTTWSLVDAERDPDAICAAVRAGKVKVQATPLSSLTAAATITDLFGTHFRRVWQQSLSPDPVRAR